MLSAIPSRYSLASKLKAICNRLDEVAVSRRNYNFQECHPHSLFSIDSGSRERDTHSFVQEARVFGREEDRDWIVTRLVSFSSSHESRKIYVIPIVGIGGMGKTTLAKFVYNDPRIETFELKLWAYVPNKFAIRTVVENIIESATGQRFSHLNNEALNKKLCHILNAQAYLLVLDNVWIEDSDEWLELMGLLEEVSKRGAIIITAREYKVAMITGDIETYKLKHLSEDHCWSLFVKCAFNEGEEEAYPLLVQIGTEIVRKCHGVPLAAKTLGCQLRMDRDESTWRHIEESELWEIKQAPRSILPSLKLSYDQLPYYLKPCFSFCSTFPKGSLIKRGDLIKKRMALGLLQSKKANEPLEDIGRKHFDELVLRSFFVKADPSTLIAECIEKYKIDWWNHRFEYVHALTHESLLNSCSEMKGLVKMHDLVHDLARYFADEETTLVSYDTRALARSKHLVWRVKEHLSVRDFPRELQTANKARSLHFRCEKYECTKKSFLDALISNFPCLRILSLSGLHFVDFPDSIGDLKHLRYLSLDKNCEMKSLPDSMCKLVNLQTLSFSLCWQLQKFPKDMHRLLSLRHLTYTSKLESFLEKGFCGWTSIHSISIIHCVHLRSLQQIGTLTTLRILQITDCSYLSSLPNNMRHLIHLEKLEICGCEKLDLMGWEGLHGLRSLRDLHIQRLPLLVHIPDGLQSISLSLRHLSIIHCLNLIALPECLQKCAFLQHLTLVECTTLSALPKGIQALKTLQQLCIADCPKLNPRCERETGEDWHFISHIPKIQIDRCFIQNKRFPTL